MMINIDPLVIPDGYKKLEANETVMSNFDHEIDYSMEERLRKEKIAAPYAAWNFHGMVWWDTDEEIFRCCIRRYGSYIATLSGTLKEIMVEASERWGGE